jgi:hypothetical protein
MTPRQVREHDRLQAFVVTLLALGFLLLVYSCS